MSDRFLLKANCSVCGTDLNDTSEEDGQCLFLGVGESIDLKCLKCGIRWRFWIEAKTNQKRLGIKNENKSKEKKHDS